jgi:hypothetical protein
MYLSFPNSLSALGPIHPSILLSLKTPALYYIIQPENTLLLFYIINLTWPIVQTEGKSENHARAACGAHRDRRRPQAAPSAGGPPLKQP